jgi:hypothetical protein
VSLAETTETEASPWPYPTMWWCVCPQDDCKAALFGPFRLLEHAQAEAESPDNGGCTWAHFAIKGEPPPHADLLLGWPTINRTEHGVPDEEIRAANAYILWRESLGTAVVPRSPL